MWLAFICLLNSTALDWNKTHFYLLPDLDYSQNQQPQMQMVAVSASNAWWGLDVKQEVSAVPEAKPNWLHCLLKQCEHKQPAKVACHLPFENCWLKKKEENGY